MTAEEIAAKRVELSLGPGSTATPEERGAYYRTLVMTDAWTGWAAQREGAVVLAEPEPEPLKLAPRFQQLGNRWGYA